MYVCVCVCDMLCLTNFRILFFHFFILKSFPTLKRLLEFSFYRNRTGNVNCFKSPNII